MGGVCAEIKDEFNARNIKSLYFLIRGPVFRKQLYVIDIQLISMDNYDVKITQLQIFMSDNQ